MNERVVPEAALRDPNALELLRVWIAERGLHCSLKIGWYKERGLSEPDAWGTILSDVARHVADALAKGYDLDRSDVLSKIGYRIQEELKKPTSPTSGDFVTKT
jgi:Domain of unknown function (DUF5076)